MATWGEQITIPGLVAGESLASWQYGAVKLASTAGQVIKATATTDVILGIVQNDPASGEPAVVAVLGVSKAVAGVSTAVAVGAHLTCNATGVITQATDNSQDFAVAIDATTAASQLFRVLLLGPSRY